MTVIPIVIGELGMITKHLEMEQDELEIRRTKSIQTTAELG